MEKIESRSSSQRMALRETLSTFALFSLFVFAMAFLSVLLSSTARAQSAALANDPATLAALAAGSDRSFVYSGQFILETTRSADEAQATSYAGSYLLVSSLTHIKSTVTGTLRLGYGQEFTYDEGDGNARAFDNPILTFAKSYLNEHDFNLSWVDSVSLSLNNSIGANRESARRRFLWSNGFSVTGAKELGRLSLRQAFSYSHGFYDYDIRDDGTVNAPDTVKSITTLYYAITPKLSIGGEFNYAYAINFKGNGMVETATQATADYMITEKIAASIGVASKRSTLEPDGVTNRVRFYAPDSAKYFVDLLILL